MRKRNTQYLKWNRLDNTATIFPVIAREGTTNVYRVAVELKEEINGEILQEAQDAVLPYFDIFRCSMKKGFFWYYFEENRLAPPKVFEEDTFPCLYMNPYSNNKYLFRVSYYGKRINLEVFHALTDGNGGFAFLKEITYAYLRRTHPEDPEITSDMPDKETSFDTSDGYLQNYAGKKKSIYRTERAVTVKGEKLPSEQLSVITGILPAEQLKQAAKKYGATINQYLVAAYAWSVYMTALRGQPSERPVNVCVPVNLRPVFGSETGKNFFAMVNASFKPDRTGIPFEEVVRIVKESLDAQITKENLEKLFSYNVSNQMNIALRSIPLFIKTIVLRRVFKSNTRAATTTLTNLGKISASPAYEKYLDSFSAILPMSDYQNIKMTAVTFKNVSTLTFSSCLKETQIQKVFFRKLAEDGAEVEIETNGVCYET